MSDFKTIAVDVRDNIATVTLNRPEKLNTYTGKMRDELNAAFDLTDADDDVRAVIVTGAGRAFCAGADLTEGGRRFAPDAAATGPHRDGGGTLTLRIFNSRKPVIAAVNGPAVGVGATMTLAMDVRLAGNSARFSFPFTRRGIVPESCSSWFLPRVVGVSRALEWLYTGRLFDAREALDCGLVRSIHGDGDLLSAARGLATEIADQTAPVSVALSRQLVRRMLGAPHPMGAHICESRALGIQGGSSDAYEGVTAFLEKRPAVFTRTVNADFPDVFPGWVEPEFT